MLVRDRTMRGLIEDWYGYLENDNDIPIDKIRMASFSSGSEALFDGMFLNCIQLPWRWLW